jgi:nascent polypeptide-associated complex subunit alpha
MSLAEEKKTRVEEHKHEENCADHDNDDVAENGVDASGKSSRGEKKFKKAMLKLGMKPVSGINRVTIRKAKNFLLYIDNPEVLISPGSENSYVVFGEAKMQDFNQNLANAEAGKFKKAEKPVEK